jgi:precorrin-2/cobalt-factor-2 C20-methyltransferase
MSGRLIGVGVGPGDPELVTLKAIRTLNEADLVAHFARNGSAGRARATVAGHLRPGIQELALRYPVTIEISKDAPAYQNAMREFYDAAALSLAAHLDAGRVVAVICEGDPLFYGSYMHLHVRLAPRFPAAVVAGVSGFSGCWSAAAMPIAQGDDVFTVIPGTLPQEAITRCLDGADAAVVMKLGRNLPKVRRALAQSGRLDRAIYVERGTMPDAVVMRLADKHDDAAPYFALVLVPGWEARR